VAAITGVPQRRRQRAEFAAARGKYHRKAGDVRRGRQHRSDDVVDVAGVVECNDIGGVSALLK